jgi:hypothetical protein
MLTTLDTKVLTKGSYAGFSKYRVVGRYEPLSVEPFNQAFAPFWCCKNSCVHFHVLGRRTSDVRKLQYRMHMGKPRFLLRVQKSTTMINDVQRFRSGHSIKHHVRYAGKGMLNGILYKTFSNLHFSPDKTLPAPEKIENNVQKQTMYVRN